jgi:hypothetical protein
MSRERKDLAVDAKRADPVGRAPVDRERQGFGVVGGDLAQELVSIARLQPGDVAGGGPAKVDRLLDERAAQSKPQQRATWPSGTRALHAAKLGAVGAHRASAPECSGAGACPCTVRTSRFVS